MVSAKEATRITENSVMDYVGSIEKGIRKNAALGKYSYEHLLDADFDIVSQVTKHLKSAGFSVDTSSEIGYDCQWRTRMTISWETNKETKEKK